MFIGDNSDFSEVESSDSESVKPLTSLRPVRVNESCWHYKWDGAVVLLINPKQETYEVPTWEILEINQSEYMDWCNDPGGGPVVTSKDVSDYVKENILRSSMARKLAGKFSESH